MDSKLPNKTKSLISLALIIAGIYSTITFYSMPDSSWLKLALLIVSVYILSYGLSFISSNRDYNLNAARIFIGIVFVFSGFVKAVDPLGSKYKFIDYFEAWNIGFMEPLALSLAILQNVVEFLIGLALLFNIFSKKASLASLLFMIFYTPITAYLALQEESTGKEFVHDCGCFGDAFILSNMQTFVKNFIILIPAAFIYYKRKKFASIFAKNIDITLLALFIAGAFGISFYSLEYLPFIDFRPYKVGTNIPKAMEIPDGAPQEIVMSYFQYKNKKTGEIKEFDQNNLPWQDTATWEYVVDQEPRREIMQKGYVPPIINFSISNSNGDITQEVITSKGSSLLVIAYDLETTNKESFKEIIKLADWAKANNIRFIGITASGSEIKSKFASENNLNFEFYDADPITLKTIVRANPGLVHIKDSVVIDKWHYNAFPSTSEIQK